ncbi:MAG: hypothetical protein EBE86_027745 [Hormoscilla sp. GUM202]|nr:hypothetical protein [Hormoscilla sp. GUM202]
MSLINYLELDRSHFWIRQKFPHLCSWGHGDRQLPLQDWTARDSSAIDKVKYSLAPSSNRTPLATDRKSLV